MGEVTFIAKSIITFKLPPSPASSFTTLLGSTHGVKQLPLATPISPSAYCLYAHVCSVCVCLFV